MTTIRQPTEDRPTSKPIDQLTASELISLLVSPQAYTVQTAPINAINERETLRDVLYCDDGALRRYGFDAVDIVRIRAVAEIARRINADAAKKTGAKITASQDAVNILQPAMRDLKIEIFRILYLDSKNRIIEIHDAAVGTVDRAFPIVRELIKKGLDIGASAMICAHNHPSGDPAPSREDESFTRGIHEAGKLMQVRMLDHVIIGDNRYYSFADEGAI